MLIRRITCLHSCVAVLLISSPIPHAAASEIQGYRCAAGHARFFANGRLSSCSVSRETSFGELTVPEGSEIYLTAEGKPRFVFLAHDARVGGYLCRGGKRAWSTALYPDGKLKTCWLAADTTIDAVPCMRAGFVADVFGGGVATYFHENGKLAGCKLAADTTIDGRGYRKGDHVRFDSAGKAEI